MINLRFGTNEFKTIKRGEERCYLLTNGLGGYSSTTLINSLSRNDHSLFMACTHSPNNRKNIISKVEETLLIEEKSFELHSQQYVCSTKNINGHVHLKSFEQDYLPKWTYFCDGVEITKTIVYRHKSNTLGIQYKIHNPTNKHVELQVTPLFQMNEIGKHHKISPPYELTLTDPQEAMVKYNDLSVFCHASEGICTPLKQQFIDDFFFSYDARDGRPAVGSSTKLFTFNFQSEPHTRTNKTLTFTLETVAQPSVESLINAEIDRQKALIIQAGFNDELASSLVRASDQFISERESTKGQTIIAGYPFFTDWGRDTMFAILGSCISTKRFKESKEIFRTFMAHLRRGLMPNLFPEGTANPLYNTVDASLLFIYALNEYYEYSGDLAFIKNEAYKSIKEIIHWYKNGTDYNIFMDNDGLIHAGEGFDQVTWMDVRFDEILPTARHGKPVEINAFWYNALKITEKFAKLFNHDCSEYTDLSQKVAESFNQQFWSDEINCLKDVVSGNDYDVQIRSNQIWAIMMPFCPLDSNKQISVVETVYEELYTPYGLRTLSKNDPQFVPEYSGSHFKRDMSYHQGTVWPFPLGGYYLAYLNVHNYSCEAKSTVKKQLRYFEDALREGCIGQIPEIYDGLYPSESRGCFAQAWSVSEILRVYQALQENH